MNMVEQTFARGSKKRNTCRMLTVKVLKFGKFILRIKCKIKTKSNDNFSNEQWLAFKYCFGLHINIAFGSTFMSGDAIG